MTVGQGKHTPGPWAVHPVADNGFRAPEPDNGALGPDFYVQGKDGACPAIVWAFMETGQANARLIAAAPTMLEALREARRAIGGAWYFTDDLLAKIDRAISLAESSPLPAEGA